MPDNIWSSVTHKWRRQWHPTPVLLPGKSHGWRSLVGYSPWGRKESNMTERLHFHFSLSCIREGNGNPLQRSCLENPGDGGAWCAAVYGVSQGRTRLSDLQQQQHTWKEHSIVSQLHLKKNQRQVVILDLNTVTCPAGGKGRVSRQK